MGIEDPYLSLLCGGVAGALSRTSVSPMERVKVLFQVQNIKSSQYQKSTIPTIIQIYKDEGVVGLFRGNGVNCIRIIPYTAIQYMVYQNLKEFLTSNGQRELNTAEKLNCGLMGGLFSVFFTYPLDLVKTRLSVLTSKVNSGAALGADLSLLGNLRTIYKTEGGIAGLYRGFVPTAAGVAPYVSLNFTFYELITEKLGLTNTTNPLFPLAIGGVSGGVAQTLVYPMDILRRRFQVATMKDVGNQFKYTGIQDALFKIYKTEGFSGLYKGWTANMWKIVPSMAVQWWAYHQLRLLLS